jgi:hypothetical protein
MSDKIIYSSTIWRSLILFTFWVHFHSKPFSEHLFFIISTSTKPWFRQLSLACQCQIWRTTCFFSSLHEKSESLVVDLDYLDDWSTYHFRWQVVTTIPCLESPAIPTTEASQGRLKRFVSAPLSAWLTGYVGRKVEIYWNRDLSVYSESLGLHKMGGNNNYAIHHGAHKPGHQSSWPIIAPMNK